MARQTGVTTLQAAADATGDGTALTVSGYNNAVLQVAGTFTGTVTFEATQDGTNWEAIAVADLGSTTRARATTATAPGLFLFDDLGGVEQVRARVSAYTDGAITVTASASDAG